MTVRPLALSPRLLPRVGTSSWSLWLAVLAIVALVYSPTLNDPFAGDDYLVLGPVRALGAWELIWKSFLFQDNIPYWRPLVSPLYALEVHGFGLRPVLFHLVVLALHLGNVLLAMILAVRLSGRQSVGAAAGLFFGISPAHATTIAQISSTVELQSVAFYLLAVLCAVRSLAGGVFSREWHAAALGCFVLALLTKESAASAAAVVGALYLLLDPEPRGRVRRAALRSAPFLVLVLPYALLTYLGTTDEPSGVARAMYDPGLHAARNLWWLAARLAAPLETGQGPDVSPAGHTGAALLLAATALLLLRGPALSRLLALWMVIALTPLTLWRPELMLGRFTYQAAIPFSILLSVYFFAASRESWARMPRSLPALLAAGLIGLSILLTVQQNRARTREALAYGGLVQRLERARPADGEEVVVLGGPFSGPFHALYLQALAETRYGPGAVALRWLPAGSDVPTSASVIRWRE